MTKSNILRFGCRFFAVVACGLALAACGSKPPKTASHVEDARVMPEFICKIDGCCAGHGEVARVQPDKLIICTDGTPSEICDCH
jgi:hypothetical protein